MSDDISSGKSKRQSALHKLEIKRRHLLLGSTSLAAASALGRVAVPGVARAADQDRVLPRPEAPFTGKIGRTVTDSTPDFPKAVEAPPGAPNILLILTDDVGFGASSRWTARSLPRRSVFE
ncbi:MAG TPA: hypothetical protein VJR47_08115 [Stellaceae bacterium]|nr:hypothetical protein [Stellaceae bacterium]